MKKLHYSFLLLLAISTGCKSDFDVVGDYKELAVVYGLLDPQNNPSNGGDGHYIRIQRSFLGEQDAAIMAAIPDSSYFNANDLSVEIREYNQDGDLTRVFDYPEEIDIYTIENKDTSGGYGFFGPEQQVYRLNDDIRVNFDYAIYLHNTKTGYRDSLKLNGNGREAKIRISNPSDIVFDYPRQSSNIAQGLPLYTTVTGDYSNKNIRFSLPDSVGYGELWLRFYYREVLNTTPNVEELKSVDWLIKVFDEGLGSNQQIGLTAETFYTVVGNALEPINGYRLIGRADVDQDGNTQDFDLFVRFAGKELADYININAQSSSGSLTDLPSHSNLSVGRGVFSSRSVTYFPRDLYLSPDASDFLQGGEHTSDLGFTTD